VNSIQISRGLRETTVAALILVTGMLVGCGSDLSMNPTSLDTNDQPVGEVPVPKGARIESPTNFTALHVSSEWVQLSWVPTATAYEAVITLDGFELARVSSTSGTYMDQMGHEDSEHVYGLTFVRGALNSREAQVALTVTGDPGSDTPKTGDLPEDGRSK